MIPRSWLFVPGDSPAKMDKALASGADALILDLEDSVALARKDDARTMVAQFLAAQPGAVAQLWVRINSPRSGLLEQDLAAIVAAAPAGVVLPKPDSGRDLAALDERLAALEGEVGRPLGAIRILPIATETPASLFHLHTYGGVTSRLAGLTWGAEDLSSAIGAMSARDERGAYLPLYDLARSLCLAGAAAADVSAIETVYPDFKDLAGLEAYLARGRRDGFLGMMAIHPVQIALINQAFTPSADEILQARQVVDLFEQTPTAGTLALDGRMLDAPHLRQAKRILERAEVARP